MICPKCQKDLPENPRRCYSCGHQFEGEPLPASPSRNATQPFQTLDDALPTSIASAREAAGITKVHLEPSLAPTKVATIQPLEPTKVFGQAPSLKPIYGWLVVVEGRQPWRQLLVTREEGRWIIGSAEDCGFILDDEKVEPHHASLRLKDDQLHLTDLDTAWGTRVKGQEISRVELQDGDEIQIGAAVLKFRRL